MNTYEIIKENQILKDENEKLKKQLDHYKNSTRGKENPDKIEEYVKRVYQKHSVIDGNSNECKLCSMDRYKS